MNALQSCPAVILNEVKDDKEGDDCSYVGDRKPAMQQR
jgi:hypothetical protein